MHRHVDAICQSLHLRRYWRNPLDAPRRIVWRTRVRQPVNSGSLTADPPKPRRILDPGSPRSREDRGARNARVHVSARHSNSRYSNLQVSRRSNEHATREKGTVSSFKFLPRVVIRGEASATAESERARGSFVSPGPVSRLVLRWLPPTWRSSSIRGAVRLACTSRHMAQEEPRLITRRRTARIRAAHPDPLARSLVRSLAGIFLRYSRVRSRCEAHRRQDHGRRVVTVSLEYARREYAPC